MHRSRALVIVLGFAGVLAAQDISYPDRKPIVANVCPFVELSGFSFQNQGGHFATNISWRNIGRQPVTAFEIVILKYDAFDRRIIGESWTVPGVNSADWRPLQPGDRSSNSTMGPNQEEVFTAIVYVRTVRLADNVVWTVNGGQLNNELRKVSPGIRDFGELAPDPRTPECVVVAR
jgi:hypothetical protein